MTRSWLDLGASENLLTRASRVDATITRSTSVGVRRISEGIVSSVLDKHERTLRSVASPRPVEPTSFLRNREFEGVFRGTVPQDVTTPFAAVARTSSGASMTGPRGVGRPADSASLGLPRVRGVNLVDVDSNQLRGVPTREIQSAVSSVVEKQRRDTERAVDRAARGVTSRLLSSSGDLLDPLGQADLKGASKEFKPVVGRGLTGTVFVNARCEQGAAARRAARLFDPPRYGAVVSPHFDRVARGFLGAHGSGGLSVADLRWKGRFPTIDWPRWYGNGFGAAPPSWSDAELQRTVAAVRAAAVRRFGAAHPLFHFAACLPPLEGVGLLQLALTGGEGETVALSTIADAALLGAVLDEFEVQVAAAPFLGEVGRACLQLAFDQVRQGEWLVAPGVVLYAVEHAIRACARHAGLVRLVKNRDLAVHTNPDGSQRTSSRAVGGVEAVVKLFGFDAARENVLRRLAYGGDANGWRHGTVEDSTEESARRQAGLTLWGLATVLAHAGVPGPHRAASVALRALALGLPLHR